MEPLIGYCKLCDIRIVLDDYILIEDRKDSKCVIDKLTRRVHELVFGVQEKRAIRVNQDRSQGFSTSQHNVIEEESSEAPFVEATEGVVGLNQILGTEDAQ